MGSPGVKRTPSTRALAYTLALVACAVSPARLGAQAPDSLSVSVVYDGGAPAGYASVSVGEAGRGATTDPEGRARLVLPEGYPVLLRIRYLGYAPLDTLLAAPPTRPFALAAGSAQLDEVVVTGTLTPTLRTESPVPVEVYTRAFLLESPEPSLFAALERVNGVRPQLNCAVCNTGDIHINGLEGPYTMVTLDGMPLVSGLATVYGLQGIPSALIERVEVVKGPAGTLYGSEAIGGLVNVITRDPERAPPFSVDAFATSLGASTLDLGGVARLSPKLTALTGVQAHYFDREVDRDADGFTDATRVRRVSVFEKLRWSGGKMGDLSLAGRYLAEARRGGQLGYRERHRGGDEVYGEAIDTRRAELLARWTPRGLPGLAVAASYTDHRQESDYGDTPYDAAQRIGFAQGTYAFAAGAHGLLVGTAARYTYYDDDTPATRELADNAPERTLLPGAFVQDEWRRGRSRVLGGLRLDYHPEHGAIWTPRLAVKLPAGEGANLRVNVGTGFRVVSLFTEEHAALSGAREVVIEGDIAPERSVSANVNYLRTWYPGRRAQAAWTFEASAWLTRFGNQIVPDYLSDPTEIRYANLGGHSVNQGASAELRFRENRWDGRAGVTYADTRLLEAGASAQRPLLSERWSGTWAVGLLLDRAAWARFGGRELKVDYAGTLYGPMLLPVQGPLDPRPAESPWWSLQSLQLTLRGGGSRVEVYGGVKNLLGFRPGAGAIARAHDPFDRAVAFDGDGQPLANAENPYALTFDPSYVYAPNTGRRYFVGARWSL